MNRTARLIVAFHRRVGRRRDPATREREQLAHGIARLLADDRRPTAALHRLAPLVRPSVTRACAPVLPGIAVALLDEHQPIPADTLAELRLFLTDGFGSPLYGDDPDAALAVAEDLGRRIDCAIPPEPSLADEVQRWLDGGAL